MWLHLYNVTQRCRSNVRVAYLDRLVILNAVSTCEKFCRKQLAILLLSSKIRTLIRKYLHSSFLTRYLNDHCVVSGLTINCHLTLVHMYVQVGLAKFIGRLATNGR